jgi:hypothetical protein
MTRSQREILNMNRPNTKTHLLEHSKAKVTLYGLYLEKYLNILSRVHSVEKIFIFDLMCGEGIYENGEKGSPIIALDKIKEHYNFNKSCPNITIWFNDLGESKIEPGLSKVARVKRFKDELKLPKKCGSKILPRRLCGYLTKSNKPH